MSAPPFCSPDELRDLIRGRPVAYDLFSGVGGMSLGLEQAGFDVTVAVEIDPVAGQYAQHNLPATRVLFGRSAGNVRTLTVDRLRGARPDRSGAEVALVAGGPPCQGFSLAGRMDSTDVRNGLVSTFARVVTAVRPLSFLLENVPGITRGNSAALQRALRLLRPAYHVCDPTALWAHDYGVPQARERVFVVGIRRDVGVLPSLPAPTTLGRTASDGLLAPPTVAEALDDLPEPAGVALLDGHVLPYDREPVSAFARALRGTTPDPWDVAAPVVWDSTLCTNAQPTVHGPDVVARLGRLGFGEVDSVSGLRRLQPDGVSTTIRAGTAQDRGSRSAPRPVHPDRARVLTTRECARLQSFPDWFYFHPVKWHGNRQVGNAVPPLLARAVGRHLLALLGQQVARHDLPPVRRDDSLVTGHRAYTAHLTAQQARRGA